MTTEGEEGDTPATTPNPPEKSNSNKPRDLGFESQGDLRKEHEKGDLEKKG